MNGQQRIFVFVVCGSSEHIHTLHIALRYLQGRTQKRIIVLTDSERNQLPIVHDDIIDVTTPSGYTDHQASIFLKTSLHRYLPQGNRYCYLDSDVLAISDAIDDIFEQFEAPIRFAADHCKMSKFSPHAVNCGCLAAKEQKRKVLSAAFDQYTVKSPEALMKKAQLEAEFKKLRSNVFRKSVVAVRYVFSGREFELNSEFRFDKRGRVWYDRDGMPVVFEADTSRIERETGLRYNRWKGEWTDVDGVNIWNDNCDHLREFIHAKFDITVSDANWQHWNGGVFLFDAQSHTFLESWFEKTIQAFSDPKWKTRDQGTLIATAWEYGLEQMVPLGKEWNFLCDHNNPLLGLLPEKGEFSDDGFRTTVRPNLVHVYHHFGDTDWYIWNWIAGQQVSLHK